MSGGVIQMPSTAWSYDDVLHAYMLGSQSVPSATEVMAYTGISEDLRGKPDIVKKRIIAKGKKGSRVHEATMLLDRGDFNWGVLDGDEPLYVLGYERAVRDLGLRVMVSEEAMIFVKDGVGPCGMKFDRVGEVTLGEFAGFHGVIDLKITCKQEPMSWGVQTAAYWFGARQRGLIPDTAGRAILWLRPNHHAEFIPIKSDLSEDLDVFFHGLAIVHWKLRRTGLSWMDMLGKTKPKV